VGGICASAISGLKIITSLQKQSGSFEKQNKLLRNNLVVLSAENQAPNNRLASKHYQINKIKF